MIFDKSTFAVLGAMEEACPQIREEMEAIPLEDYLVWPDTDAYQGDWRLFILDFEYPEDLGVDYAANQARCPRTMEWFRNTPGVFSAGFSCLSPRSRILKHVDLKPETQLRAHLGLQVPERSRFRVADQVFHWKEGEALTFEGLIDHEAGNEDDAPRITFMIDFRLTPEELEVTRKFMKDIDPRFLVAGSGRA